MRTKALFVTALCVMLLGSNLPVEAQTLTDTYNGDNLHNSFDAMSGGCVTQWEGSALLEGPAWLAQSRLTLTGPCSGSEQSVMIKWHHAGAVYIESVYVWGRSKDTHYGRFYGGGQVWQTSGFPSSQYEIISVNAWITQGDIIIEKIGANYTGYTNDFITSITQVQFNYRFQPPTATLTPTPRNTATPYPSTTSYPTASPAHTGIPTVLPQTKIAPQLTPYATIDTCPSDDITTPCAEPMYEFPTMAIPTFNLPSPTMIALLPTNTPAPITFTPSATMTLTLTPTLSATPGASPTGTPDYSVLPTLNTTAWYDGSNALGAAIPSLMPMIGIGFDLGSATPVGIEQAAERFGTGAGQAIRLAKSLELTDINKFGGIISLGLLLFAFSILIEVVILILPLVNMFLGWLWKLIKLIPFIE